MPTQYNGDSANITNNLSSGVSITSSTNTSPIVISTSPVAHGLTNDDLVDINGHLVNTSANGVYQVAGVTTYTFQLVGTTGVGVGGATGTVQSLALAATYPVPSDGDLANGASIDVPLMALGDRTAFLAQATGAYKTVWTGQVVHNDDTFASWVAISAVPLINTWGSLTGSGSQGLNMVGLVTPIYGDILDVRWSFTIGALTSTGGATKVRFGLLWSGISTTPASAKIPGSAGLFSLSDTFPRPVELSARYPVTQTVQHGAGFNQIDLGINGFDGTNIGCSLIGDYTVSISVLRYTSMPQ